MPEHPKMPGNLLANKKTPLKSVISVITNLLRQHNKLRLSQPLSVVEVEATLPLQPPSCSTNEKKRFQTNNTFQYHLSYTLLLLSGRL